MKASRFWISYVILVAVQIVLCDCFNLTQLLTLWFLPVLVLCMPIRTGTVAALLIAFATGMAVDFLSQGVPGLCTAALLPVAFCRRFIIGVVFGSEVFSRSEDISVRRQGIPKMTLAIVMATGLFLLIYILADGAGTRPFWFNAGRFVVSLLVDSVLSLFLAGTLSNDEGSRWR